jgi:23S rRNA-/tRNA-specific pseudouridylate synthase
MQGGIRCALRDRFDPPVLRHRWVTAAAASRAGFLADARARTATVGWGEDVFERMLRHGGLHLDARPHGGADLPPQVSAGVHADAHAFAWEPEAPALGPERILLDRDGLVAVDKPAFLPVQRSRASALLSLEAAARALLGAPDLAPVHRLDRETSGVLLLARDRTSLGRAARAFRDGSVRKRYLALVAPVPAQHAWEVEGFLGRVLDPRRYRFALFPSAGEGRRPSHTRFRVIGAAGGRALVEALPTTGRTHQIRVHLAAGGTPVVGDPVYGPAAPAPAASRAERLQLHATVLELAPGPGPEILAIRAPLAADLEPSFPALVGSWR